MAVEQICRGVLAHARIRSSGTASVPYPACLRREARSPSSPQQTVQITGMHSQHAMEQPMLHILSGVEEKQVMQCTRRALSRRCRDALRLGFCSHRALPLSARNTEASAEAQKWNVSHALKSTERRWMRAQMQQSGLVCSPLYRCSRPLREVIRQRSLSRGTCVYKSKMHCSKREAASKGQDRGVTAGRRERLGAPVA